MYSFLRFSIASLKTSEFKILSASAALTTSSCVTDIYTKLNKPYCGRPCLPTAIGLTISSMFGCTKDGINGVETLGIDVGIIGCGIIGCGTIGSLGIFGIFGMTGIGCGFGIFAKIFCGNVCIGLVGIS